MFEGPLKFIPETLSSKYEKVINVTDLDAGDTIVYVNRDTNEIGCGELSSVTDMFFSVSKPQDETLYSKYLGQHDIWLVKKVELSEPSKSGARVLFHTRGVDFMAIRVLDKEKDGEFAWAVLVRDTPGRDGWTTDHSEFPGIYTWHTLRVYGLKPYKE